MRQTTSGPSACVTRTVCKPQVAITGGGFMRLVRGLIGRAGLVAIALAFAGYSTVLSAQTTSASVTGSVQDSQAGVLPGVTVTMISRTQGNTLTAVTDDGGRF